MNLLSNGASGKLGKSIVAKPEMFDGDKNKWMGWSRQMLLYLKRFEVEPTDQQKILIILSFMCGENAAGRFADLYMLQHIDGLHKASFLDFIEKLTAVFQPCALCCQAEEKLLNLKQGKETVEDFITKMRQLVLEAEYDVVTHGRILIGIIRRGIHNDVVEYVEQAKPELLKSEDFFQWEKAVTRANQVLKEIAARK